ncbi:MAG TPA: hypothetical protein VEI54_07130 [Candidatus Limnocylindrales bacterium]|nr:hypothetical protein [Candidatus Limnocylindrales bacterium]
MGGFKLQHASGGNVCPLGTGPVVVVLIGLLRQTEGPVLLRKILTVYMKESDVTARYVSFEGNPLCGDDFRRNFELALSNWYSQGVAGETDFDFSRGERLATIVDDFKVHNRWWLLGSRLDK